jgi:hypothetical protein
MQRLPRQIQRPVSENGVAFHDISLSCVRVMPKEFRRVEMNAR